MISPDTDDIIEIIISVSIGIIFCFCFSISVKKSAPATASPEKHTTGTTPTAHPGERKTFINISSIDAFIINLTKTLIRFTSTSSGENENDQTIQSDQTTTALHAGPPVAMFRIGQIYPANRNGHLALLIMSCLWSFRALFGGYTISIFSTARSPPRQA